MTMTRIVALPRFLPALVVASVLLADGWARAEDHTGAQALWPEGRTTFAFAGGRAQRERVLAAIERATSEMTFIIRPIARRRLAAGNRVFESIAVAREGANLVVDRDGNVVSSPADGSETEWTGSDGKTYRVSQRLTPGGFTQTFVGKDGERRNTYSLSEDGTLRLEVTVRSSRLPAPLEYDLTYERVGARGPAGGAGMR